MNKLQSMYAALQGKKTYLAVLAIIIYSLLSVYLHEMTWNQAVEFILTAAGLGGIHSAVTTTKQ